MDTQTAKQIVAQGLNDRKNVRAAEARAEKLREDVAAVNDARFREKMAHRKAMNAWQREREDLTGTVSRQRAALRQLREENEELHKREREAQQRRILISAVKAVVAFGLLIVARDLELVVSWLADSLLAFTATYLFCAVVALTHKK